MEAKLTRNIDEYNSESAIQKYSHYFLYPNEKYLVEKYFSKADPILDLACGAGRTTVSLHELGYKLHGIDYSEALIHVAKVRFPYLTFEQGSYCEINQPDASWNAVLISHNGLDYAYPESQRELAISECSRVLKKGGHFIFSTHNIKSLHMSPYFRHRKKWFLKNCWRAFRDKDYIYDLNMFTFYSSPEYCIAQVEKFGFKLVEEIGFRNSNDFRFNKFISPYIHFVFQKI